LFAYKVLAIASQHHVRVCGELQTWGITIELSPLGVLFTSLLKSPSSRFLPSFTFQPLTTHLKMASSNPANFANLPKDELKEIAAKGGHASSHGAHHESGNSDHPDRNPDGTFTKGSELAKELGAQGGHAAHHESTSGAGSNDSGVSSHMLLMTSFGH
jgi:general stress protein YciG